MKNKQTKEKEDEDSIGVGNPYVPFEYYLDSENFTDIKNNSIN